MVAEGLGFNEAFRKTTEQKQKQEQVHISI